MLQNQLLRDQFPIFQHKTFINSCSKGALSLPVKAAFEQYLTDWETLGSPWDVWVAKLEETRACFAALVGASTDEVAVTGSVSAAVSALASAIDFSGPRNKVLVTDFEFPTVAQNWHAQEVRGAKVVHLPEVSGRVPLASFAEQIDDATALVAVSHVCYRNGSMQDIKAITELAHAHGALVLLDAYQSLGTMPLDFKTLGVDILVGGALKYLLGPAGVAFMVVREELLTDLWPTMTGWFAQEDIMALDIYAHRPSSTARRFESGTPPNPNLYAALAGLELVQSVGLEAIAHHLRELTAQLKAGVHERGLCLATTNEHGAMLAIKAQDVETLVSKLAEEGIIVSSRDDNLRVSAHFYNISEDITRLLEALDKYPQLLSLEALSASS